jgi:hypothetical protein
MDTYSTLSIVHNPFQSYWIGYLTLNNTIFPSDQNKATTYHKKDRKKQKKVRFCESCKLVLIPTRNEYKKHNLDLWWNSQDFYRFRTEYLKDENITSGNDTNSISLAQLYVQDNIVERKSHPKYSYYSTTVLCSIFVSVVQNIQSYTFDYIMTSHSFIMNSIYYQSPHNKIYSNTRCYIGRMNDAVISKTVNSIVRVTEDVDFVKKKIMYFIPNVSSYCKNKIIMLNNYASNSFKWC